MKPIKEMQMNSISDSKTCSQPIFPMQTLHVAPWPDHVINLKGYAPKSAYVENYWLPILGPTTTFLLRKISTSFECSEDSEFILYPFEWAQNLGVHPRGGKHGPFWKSITRACRFKLAQIGKNRLYVRKKLPPLSIRQVEKLPRHLQISHLESKRITN